MSSELFLPRTTWLITVKLYNEYETKTAAWLSELIRRKVIPNGKVDTRSITEIQPTDVEGFTQVHLFAGIGGWSEALRVAGWPDDVPVWTGSCPCQPFSSAGKQKGEQDERHLWPEMLRLIRQRRPAVVFGEQVASRLGREWLARVRADLEGLGYVVGAADLCAAGEGAPHIRQRLYWGAVRQDRTDWLSNDVLPRLQVGGDVGRVRAGEVRSPEGQGPVGGGDVGWVEHPAGDGRIQRRSESGRGSVAGGCESGGVDDTTSPRFSPEGIGQQAESEWRCSLPGVGCESGGVGNSMLGRLEEPPQRDVWPDGSKFQTPPRPNPHGPNFWSRYSVVHCRDGRVRRFEPESQPLAHGVPGRVGLLRGYGNAIVPQVAARFVGNFCEAVRNAASGVMR